jgi:hypothetical protein
MGDLTVKSTSRISAECSDFVLRETTTTRLVFRPLLVQNEKKPSASVKGSFVFQRKGSLENWEDIPSEPLSSLKMGESCKLALNSSEVLTLFEELTGLYQLYSCEGIPRGETEFVRVSNDLARISKIPASKLQEFLQADQTVGSSLLTTLLEWAARAKDLPDLIKLLVELGPDSLKKLNTAVGVQTLKSALELWNKNKRSSDEEFWQRTFTENSFVLEYVFSWPCTIVKGKAYIGGKNIFNTEGKIVDFLVKNRITENAALIEIKTPQTPLLGRKYRQGVTNVSEDLSGSILQVLDYKQTLNQYYHSITQGQSDLFSIFDPKAVVLIGNGRQMLSDTERKKSFELFRNQMSHVSIITFDELFKKTAQLISTLEHVTDEDDVPF